MRKLYHIILVLFVALFIGGCCDTPKVSVLAEVERNMGKDLDVSEENLDKIHYEDLDGEARCHYILLKTLIDAKKGKAMTEESKIGDAFRYFLNKVQQGRDSNKDDVNRLAKSAMYMGDWYALVDSMKACEDTYRLSIQYASECHDAHTLYCALSRLAKRVVYSDAEEALKLALQALEIYEAKPDEDQNYLSLLNDAANYSFLVALYSDKNFDQACEYANRELEFATERNIAVGINQSQCFFVNLFNNTGRYDKALEHAKLVKLQEGDTEHSFVLHTILAECYLNCDSLDQAKANYLIALGSKVSETQYVANIGMAQVMLHLDEKDSAESYYNSALECKESIFFEALKAKDDYYKEASAKGLENEKLRFESKMRRFIFGAVIATILIAILFAAREIFLRTKREKSKQMNRLLSRKHHLELHILEKQYLKREKLLLEEKIDRKDHMIHFLQNYIIERYALVKKMNENKDSHISLTKKDWKDIELILDEIDEGCISKLRQEKPELTEEDIHLCILVRLHMSNPVIGSIYCISVSAVQHRKQKLKKEGLGVFDPGTTLEQALHPIWHS